MGLSEAGNHLPLSPQPLTPACTQPTRCTPNLLVPPSQMDAAIVHLFDPHGYLERALSILQSTPAAVSIMSRHPHQVRPRCVLVFSPG